jgi:hypothetical protein
MELVADSVDLPVGLTTSMVKYAITAPADANLVFHLKKDFPGLNSYDICSTNSSSCTPGEVRIIDEDIKFLHEGNEIARGLVLVKREREEKTALIADIRGLLEKVTVTDDLNLAPISDEAADIEEKITKWSADLESGLIAGYGLAELQSAQSELVKIAKTMA